jgi:uracil-DNA glycosylase family 4
VRAVLACVFDDPAMRARCFWGPCPVIANMRPEINDEIEGMSNKQKRFESLIAEAEKCDACLLCKGAKKRVVGEGNLNAIVVFIGEAPGRSEDEKGRPFVGSAGKLLNKLLSNVGLERGDVFISNIVECRPPSNRRPKKDEIEACSSHLEKLLGLIRPRVVVPMGSSSLEYFYERYGLEGVVIGDAHGKSMKIITPWGEVTLFPMYHPAAAIYNRKLLGKLGDDMGSLMELLK